METSEIKIVKAEQKDLQEILDLQYIAYQSEAKLFHDENIPPLRQTIDEVQDEYVKGTIIKAVDKNGRIIGSVRAYCENETVYIGKLMVHPSQQRKGLGSKLLMEVERYYPNKRYELFTSTRSSNNIKLYESLGYHAFSEKSINQELKFVYMEK